MRQPSNAQLRFLPAIFGAALMAGQASAQELPIHRLTTFSGTLPCADCVGTRHVLTLRPDGLFYLQRTYLRTENAGQRVLELGAWNINAGTLSLVSSLGEVQRLEIGTEGTLRLTERDGQLLDPTPDYTLAREPEGRVPDGAYRIRGTYTERGGRRTLQPCGSDHQFSVDPGERPLLQQKLAKAGGLGKQALVLVTAALDPPPADNAKFVRETVHVSSLMSAETGGVCGGGSPPRTPDLPMPPAKAAAAPAQPRADSVAQVIGIRWVLVEAGGENVAPNPDAPEAAFRLLEQGRVTGTTGCNRFTGAYAIEGHNLRFKALAMTQMACPETRTIEANYVKAMNAARSYQFSGDTLELLDEAGRAVAGFRASLGN